MNSIESDKPEEEVIPSETKENVGEGEEDPNTHAETTVVVPLPDEEKLPSDTAALTSSQEIIPESEQGIASQPEENPETEAKAEEEKDASPKRPLPELIEEACQREEEMCLATEADLQRHIARFAFWSDRCQKLQQALGNIIEKCREQFKISEEAMATLPQTFQQELSGRQKALSIPDRQINRLAQYQDQLTPATSPEATLERRGQAGWEALLMELQDTDAEGFIQQQLNMLTANHWQRVSASRKTADEQHNRLMDFVRDLTLPALDSLDDGEPNSRQIVERLKLEAEEHTDSLAKWLNVYQLCRMRLQWALQEAKIQSMKVQRGEEIDYDRCEPLEVEADPALQDDQIVSVFRQGYVCSISETESEIVRKAQVIVARNGEGK